MTGQVEIVIEAAHGIDAGTGPWEGLRVSYRPAGSRAWSTFSVVGGAGQTLGDLLSAALLLVARSDADGKTPDRVTVGTDDQLELGAIA